MASCIIFVQIRFAFKIAEQTPSNEFSDEGGTVIDEPLDQSEIDSIMDQLEFVAKIACVFILLLVHIIYIY